jgi:hypothetical protein
MKRFQRRATAGWVAVVLEKAEVLAIDWFRPARVKLCVGWWPIGCVPGRAALVQHRFGR